MLCCVALSFCCVVLPCLLSEHFIDDSSHVCTQVHVHVNIYLNPSNLVSLFALLSFLSFFVLSLLIFFTLLPFLILPLLHIQCTYVNAYQF